MSYKIYDIAIIGAGINGCSLAYEFLKEDKSVLLLDKEGVAAGGSGAAGAFISPKFSKAGELKAIINNAFLYSMEYYEKNFPNAFSKTQLFHIAKDEKEAEILKYFKQHTMLSLLQVTPTQQNFLTKEAQDMESISLESGIVNAQKVCKEMIKEADFFIREIQQVLWKEEKWIINEEFKAKKIIFTTGAYKTIIDEPYIKLRGVWGHRIDIQTTTTNPNTLHQYVSISSSKNGKIAIGATHNVHYHPQKTDKAYDIESGRRELLQKASQTIHLKDIQILKDYTGLRSGSFDYMPIVGSLVDSNKTLQNSQKKIRIKKPDFQQFHYYPNLYMMNGSGGYGFVLAPYLAHILKEHILYKKPIDNQLLPARFFARWAKRKS